MKKIAVLGSGLVGTTIALDLGADSRYAVTAFDLDQKRLDRLEKNGLDVQVASLATLDEIRQTIKPFDVVVGALPSRFGYQALQAVILEGKPYCDISFMPQDALGLDQKAREAGVCAVVDCGVAPGLSNLTIGRSHALFDKTHSAIFYVGGLPRMRSFPCEYKAPFAPADVIEEYTRPARMRINGKDVVRPALSDIEEIEVESVGTLEGFNTDGLRSLLKTIDATDLREKTLRYPGHAKLMKILRQLGLFQTEAIDVDGQKVSPLALTSRLLFEKWALEPDELEFTYLKVVVTGERRGRRETHTYTLFAETDLQTGHSSMARTTGFPCAIATRMLAEGTFCRAGVWPPELLATQAGLFESMVSELKRRGVHLMYQEDAD